MASIFWAFVPAALLHIAEEYVFPGGFPEAVRRLNPRLASAATPTFHLILNALFIVLVVVGAFIGESGLVFSLAIAGLLFYNALFHLVGTVMGRRYVPGLITGLAVYLPLSTYALAAYLCQAKINLGDLVSIGLLGMGLQLSPFAVLALFRWQAQENT